MGLCGVNITYNSFICSSISLLTKLQGWLAPSHAYNNSILHIAGTFLTALKPKEKGDDKAKNEGPCRQAGVDF